MQRYSYAYLMTHSFHQFTLKTQYHDMKQQILNEYTNELHYVEKFNNYVQMNFFLGVLHKKN